MIGIAQYELQMKSNHRDIRHMRATESVLGILYWYGHPDGLARIVLQMSVVWKQPMWRLIGGGVQFVFGKREELIAALNREVREETGLSIRGIQPLGEIKKTPLDKKALPHTQYVFDCSVESLDGFKESAVDGDDHLINRVFLLSDVLAAIDNQELLCGFGLLADHVRILRAAINGEDVSFDKRMVARHE